MKTLLEAYQSPVGEILIKWTVLVALGWCAHALLRSRDARWRLILWRGILCGGLLLLLTPLFSVPTYEILVDDQAVQRMTMNLSATAASKPKAMETKVEGEQHGKVENLSAFFETLLLLITCIWIIRESVGRLMHGNIDVDASIWAFVVMGISIVVDITRSRMLHRVAVKHKSQALEADALHFSTDVWSSAVVLVGLFCVKLSDWFPKAHFLGEMDSIAALAVAAIVIWVSVQLGIRTVNELLDTAPKDLAEKVKGIAESVENVKGCHAVRVRNSGAEVFIDAHLDLEGNLSLKEAHYLTELVEEAIRKEIPGADVTVHEKKPQQISNGHLSAAITTQFRRLVAHEGYFASE